MKKYKLQLKLLICLCLISINFSQKLLIPMDQTQNDHLKSYGIAYYALKRNINVEWLLNFQGGSFLIDSQSSIKTECKIRGVTFIEINNEVLEIYGLYISLFYFCHHLNDVHNNIVEILHAFQLSNEFFLRHKVLKDRKSVV